MKAMVYQQYGDPCSLELQETNIPAPGREEVLVRVRSASVNWLDWHFLTGKPFLVRLMAGLIHPAYPILGIDLAGEVERVGKNADRFLPGDAVFGAAARGCFAEYVCVPEANLALKPDQISFDQAAAVPAAASTALRALRDLGHLQAGQSILINGASGGVGIFAVQLAIGLGAYVTAVCSTSNLRLVHSLGADQVLDYTREDFTKISESYDMIFDVAAIKSFSECREVLKPGGIYITTAFSPRLLLQSALLSTGTKKMVPLSPKPPTQNDLLELQKLLDQGVINPVVEKQFPLVKLPDAIRYLVDGHARGKVVVSI